MRFADRVQAGKALANRLREYASNEILILGIPRGGTIVGRALKDELGGELGIVITKKIGFPGNPEYGIGAVADDGTVVLTEAGKKSSQVTEEYLTAETERQKEEISRRMQSYDYELPESLQGKTVIVVDDGIATGMTVMAALRSLKKKNPKKLILAVPVAPSDTIAKLQSEADEIVTLSLPKLFFAVGQFYNNFDQVTDEEVIAALHEKADWNNRK
jgi:putative phosphoribosyl transferase